LEKQLASLSSFNGEVWEAGKETKISRQSAERPGRGRKFENEEARKRKKGYVGKRTARLV